MEVIGLGVGRTGTLSLKHALERLGFGPCHHMLEVEARLPVQLPLWTAALDGRPDWPAIYEGYRSAVDWPTAGFARELAETHPEARFVVNHRAPEGWADSYGDTIDRLLVERAALPAHIQDWIDMVVRVTTRTGFPPGLDRAGLLRAFAAHLDTVRALIPPDRLLVFDVRQGWGPLCAFLGVPVPDEPFPRSNDRAEFWSTGAVVT